MRDISPYERYGVYAPASDGLLVEHVVNVSETITGIAYLYYGDWRPWREIADRNGIADPRLMRPGMRLLIPALQPERGHESFS